MMGQVRIYFDLGTSGCASQTHIGAKNFDNAEYVADAKGSTFALAYSL